MLLKQSNPEHATNTGSMSTPSLSPSASDTTPTNLSHNDLLDDVFGSDDDNSPLFEDSEYREQEPHRHHPSDMHRLQQEHTTAGYRDAIAVAKASSLQAGFDEGFGLGGTLGLQVGRLLGLLEGIAAALASSEKATASSEAAAAAANASQLLANARTELALRSVFAPEFWHEDGTWKYDVDEKDAESEGAVLFSHVAAAHPLVRKWTATVSEQMRQWGLQEQPPLLQRREGEEERTVGGPAVTTKASLPSQSEAKAPRDALSW